MTTSSLKRQRYDMNSLYRDLKIKEFEKYREKFLKELEIFSRIYRNYIRLERSRFLIET